MIANKESGTGKDVSVDTKERFDELAMSQKYMVLLATSIRDECGIDDIKRLDSRIKVLSEGLRSMLITICGLQAEKSKEVTEHIKASLSIYWPRVGKRVIENLQQWLPDMEPDTSSERTSMRGDMEDTIWYVTRALKRELAGNDLDTVAAAIEEVLQWLPIYEVDWQHSQLHDEACGAAFERVDRMSVKDIKALCVELDRKAAAYV